MRLLGNRNRPRVLTNKDCRLEMWSSDTIEINHELFAGYQIPENCRQLFVVQTIDWASTIGTVYCYEWYRDSWKRSLGPFKCWIGGRGLGWGIDSHINPDTGPRKREGDRHDGPCGVKEPTAGRNAGAAIKSSAPARKLRMTRPDRLPSRPSPARWSG